MTSRDKQLFTSLSVGLALAACGGDTGDNGAGGATGGTGATGGGGTGATGGNGGSAGTNGGGGSSANCDSWVDAIAGQMSGVSCTSIVRIAYATHAIASHAFVCGNPGAVDEGTARAAATADTGYGDGTLVGGPGPLDEWVFYKSATDLGGVGVVSARTGLSVFGGSIIWAGTGSVNFPTSWDSGSMGSNCPVLAKPKARGFDLAQAGAPLSDTQIGQAIDTVWNTALPAGITKKNSVIVDSVVLLYAPSVGYSGPDGAGFDPKNAEYVVMVNSGSTK